MSDIINDGGPAFPQWDGHAIMRLIASVTVGAMLGFAVSYGDFNPPIIYLAVAILIVAIRQIYSESRP